MIINDNNLSEERLINNPIFLLTGDRETTKFFSSLSSACIKLGYYIEDLIVEKLNLPIQHEIEHNCLFPETKYVLVKPKFGKEIPDIVLVDEIKKTIDVFEIKTNLRNADSKKAHGEKEKYKKLNDFLVLQYPEYIIKIYVVDFMGTLLGATTLYRESNIIEVISGIKFCKLVHIDYDEIISQIKESQKVNREFINNFKKIL